MITNLSFQNGNRFLYERTLADPWALIASGQFEVITRDHVDPRNPDIAITFPVTLENGERRMVVAELDYRFFSALAQRLDHLYALNPSRN